MKDNCLTHSIRQIILISLMAFIFLVLDNPPTYAATGQISSDANSPGVAARPALLPSPGYNRLNSNTPAGLTMAEWSAILQALAGDQDRFYVD